MLPPSPPLLLRVASLLLSLLVLVGAVGVPTAAWQCPMTEAAPVAVSCCAEEPAVLIPFAKPADDGCCVVTVAYTHLITNSVGPVFALDWPAVVAILPVVTGAWSSVGAGPVVAAATRSRLFSADSGPPDRVAGRALVLALHQLRT